MDRQPLSHRSPCQDLGLSRYFNYDEEDNHWNSADTTRNIYVVSHSENSDSRLIPTAVASPSPTISTSSFSSSSLSVPSKKRKSSSLSSSSSSSSLSTFLSEGDDDLSSFLLSLSDRTGLRMHVNPLRCEDIEEDYHRSIFSQQPVVFLDNKDQEQDQSLVQGGLVGSIPDPSPTPLSLSRKRNQEEDHKVVEQNMTLADLILMTHRNNDALDTKESLLKSCTDPNPAARNKRQGLQ
mmetsp:Transcript_42244/g.101662  ORF Transcript_42244/g.101662 Transcript_42244/m.101662 type:complete len:237 (+) Transcript_42244:297-1007(+)|eukprot:CAMPEP_0113473242 /NCGR_PEP_ID=MMETSP0014_2-20120614/17941_1 /TAXON_ID=2857 /ORGANISM="Nitzschia sp." /LENGTH=236 /DNA_ID=CAMNT_0000365999 /DNA_START=209 /DNA_END=919 /DNA_ORIENTATION=+ /assembly_acc=CAM_ASM_000159